jgi:hypothetical protein
MRKPWAGILLLLSIASAASAQPYTASGNYVGARPNGYFPANQYGYYPGSYYGYAGYSYPQGYGSAPNGYANALPPSPSVPMVYAPPSMPQPPAGGNPLDGAAETGPASPPSGNVAPQNIRDPYDDYFRPHRECTWFNGSYVYAKMKAYNVPPLITTGDPTNAAPGALNPVDGPGTVILYGQGSVPSQGSSGFRIEAGYWFDPEDTFSADLGFLYVLPNSHTFSVSSDGSGSPVLARPIFSTLSQNERAFLVAAPAAFANSPLTGSASVETSTDFWGVELNGRTHGYFGQGVHVDVLVGFRTMRLDDSMRIQDQATDVDGGFLTFKNVPLGAGDSLVEIDHFGTSNQFYGFQLGGEFQWEHPWFSVGLIAKVAVGTTQQDARIDGSATLVPAVGTPTSAPGGILTQVSNIGSYSRYAFGIVPEVGASLNFDITNNIRLRTAYSFMAWNNVMRPGDIIDRTVNPGLPAGSPAFGTPGPARPSFAFHDEVFTMHTVSLGLEIHF